MTTRELASVTLETLENYRAAATQAVAASRAGSHRLVGMINGTLDKQVYPYAAKVAPLTVKRLDEVSSKVSAGVLTGLDEVADRTETVIDRAGEVAVQQVQQVADLATGFDNVYLMNGLDAAARLMMPGAKLALAVSSKMAESATALADAAGVPSRRTRKAGKAVRQAAGAVQRKARAAARKVEAVAPAKPAKPARAAKARAQAVADTVAKAVKAPKSRARKAVAEVVEMPAVKRARRTAAKAVESVAEAAAA